MSITLLGAALSLGVPGGAAVAGPGEGAAGAGPESRLLLAQARAQAKNGVVKEDPSKVGKQPPSRPVGKPSKRPPENGPKVRPGARLEVGRKKVDPAQLRFRRAARAREEAIRGCERAMSRLSKADVEALRLRGFRRALIEYRKAMPQGARGALATSELRTLSKEMNAFLRSKQSKAPKARPVRDAMTDLARRQRAMRDAKARLTIDAVDAIREAAGTDGLILLVEKDAASNGKRRREESAKKALDGRISSRGVEDESIEIGSATTVVEEPMPVLIEVTVIEEPPEDAPAVFITPGGNEVSEDMIQAIVAAGGIAELRNQIASSTSTSVNITPIVSLEADTETLSLFEFADQVGPYDNIIIDAAPPVTCGGDDNASGYAGLFSVSTETTDCVEVARDENRIDEIVAALQRSPDAVRELLSEAEGCTATLYEHSRYRGKSLVISTFRTGITHLNDHGMNDKVSSVKIDFSACPGSSLVLYKHDDYKDQILRLTRSSSNVGEEANDEITSVKLNIAN